jgi:hypothetical protein
LPFFFFPFPVDGGGTAAGGSALDTAGLPAPPDGDDTSPSGADAGAGAALGGAGEDVGAPRVLSAPCEGAPPPPAGARFATLPAAGDEGLCAAVAGPADFSCGAGAGSPPRAPTGGAGAGPAARAPRTDPGAALWAGNPATPAVPSLGTCGPGPPLRITTLGAGGAGWEVERCFFLPRRGPATGAVPSAPSPWTRAAALEGDDAPATSPTSTTSWATSAPLALPLPTDAVVVVTSPAAPGTFPGALATADDDRFFFFRLPTVGAADRALVGDVLTDVVTASAPEPSSAVAGVAVGGCVAGGAGRVPPPAPSPPRMTTAGPADADRCFFFLFLPPTA